MFTQKILAIVVLTISVVMIVSACAPAPTPTATPVPPTPTQIPPTSTPTPVPPTPTPIPTPLTGVALVVKNFYDALNASIKDKNIDAAMAFFADNAVYTVYTGVKYTGRADIQSQSWFQRHADVNTQYALRNIEVTGNKVTFQMQWVNDGTFGSWIDVEVLVQGDKIISMSEH